MNNRLNIIVAWGIRVILIAAAALGIVLHIGSGDINWMNIFVIGLTLLLTFLPNILARTWRINLPENLQIVIIIFVFAANYLGELHNFYYKFSWWDDMLHFISGIVLGLVGFMLVDTLNRFQMRKMQFELSPFFVAFFAFTFAVAAGAVWEIFEYCMDTFFGMNMQKYMIDPQAAVAQGFGVTWQGPGLNDTMHDLILDTLAAFFTAAGGYFKLKAEGKRFRPDHAGAAAERTAPAEKEKREK